MSGVVAVGARIHEYPEPAFAVVAERQRHSPVTGDERGSTPLHRAMALSSSGKDGTLSRSRREFDSPQRCQIIFMWGCRLKGKDGRLSIS